MIERREEENIKKVKNIIEALLFATGEPVSLKEISNILEYNEKDCEQIIDDMIKERNTSDSPILLIKMDARGNDEYINDLEDINNIKYQFCTNEIYREELAKLLDKRPNPKLTKAAFEVLSIIAYNDNISRAQIEEIRGVTSDSVITRLLDYGLIKENGKKDLPGKPMGYIVSEKFFLTFGINSKKDLPKISIDDEKIKEDNNEIKK